MQAVADAIGSICACVGSISVIGLICGTFLIYTGKVSFQELKELRKKKGALGPLNGVT